MDKTSVQMSEKADYGNWVPAAMMKTLWCASAALGVGTLLLFLLFKNTGNNTAYRDDHGTVYDDLHAALQADV